jgi:cytochrome c nitrite reductase small subunit
MGAGRVRVPFSVPLVVLCVLVGVLAGAGGYTAHYGEATAYLSDDPRACTNCHVMREHYDGWQKASHHAVANCNDCHLPVGFVKKYLAKAKNGWNHSSAFTLQNFHEPIRIHSENAAIVEANCVRCHDALVGHLAPSARADEPFGCVRCHAGVGHGPSK